jgi:uncharacterized protein with PIN domain
LFVGREHRASITLFVRRSVGLSVGRKIRTGFFDTKSDTKSDRREAERCRDEVFISRRNEILEQRRRNWGVWGIRVRYLEASSCPSTLNFVGGEPQIGR